MAIQKKAYRNPSQKAFCTEFEKHFSDTVNELVLVQLNKAYLKKETYSPLPLTFPAGRKEMWVLLVFTQKGMYLYDHASESALMSLFRSSSGGAAAIAQHAYIPYERIISVELCKAKKGLFTSDIYIRLTYTADGQKTATLPLIICSGNKADIETVKKYCGTYPRI